MSETVLYTLTASILTSLVSFVGIVLIFSRKAAAKIAFTLTSFAAGALIGDAFLHLIPETVESVGELGPDIGLTVLVGIIAFYVLERVVHIHHLQNHSENEKLHPVVVNSLVSDGLHNFVDGLAIAASFLVSPQIGIATTLAVILHEIPQEIGDFGILISKGLTINRALFFNFLSAVTAVAGAIVGLILFEPFEPFLPYALAVTAGGFIYIALADLVPDIHAQSVKAGLTKKTSAIYSGVASSAFFSMLLGIAAMYLLLFVE